MRAQPHRIGTRLQCDEDARFADLRAQAGQGGGDGRGVMCEIVVHPYAIDIADQFHAPLDAFERAERRKQRAWIGTSCGRGGDAASAFITL